MSLVCCVAGIPGSGKSTLGRALAVELGATLLDQDTATNPLLAEIARLVGAGDDWDHPALRGSVRQARYACLLDVAAENVLVGRPVVIVAPFTGEVADPVRWAALPERFPGVPVRLVWVAVSAAEAQRRRRARNLPRDAAWVGAGADVMPAPPVPVVPYLAADGAVDPAAEAARLAGGLRSSP
jgi:predicted kinase